jgi:hypothetical protein
MADFDTTGGGEGNSAPTGGGNVSDATSSSVDNSPQPIDLDDNALIRVKGSDKPVKFSDHVKGFQSQFTKASQKAAQLERALAEREEKIRQYEAAQQQAQRQPQGQAEDVYASLRQLPYLTGEDAVGVVESIGQQLRQRDMVLMGALKQMQEMQKRLGTLHESHSSQSFESKIQGFLQQGGYDSGYADLAREIYLAYEGDDLDSEFPQIFASRVEQIEKLIEAKRQAKINANRKQPFVPGKGGQTSPSKPLQLKANASAKEITEELWESMQNSGT